MKSVDFTVQRLIETSSDFNAGLRQRPQAAADSKQDHVNLDDVNNDVTADEERSTGSRDEHEDFSSRSKQRGHVEQSVIHPSLYLDYARQFLWQLTAAYRPGLFTYCICIDSAFILFIFVKKRNDWIRQVAKGRVRT